jgi:hypothetical protein
MAQCANKTKSAKSTRLAQGARAAGNLTPEMQTEICGMLDKLNDDINAAEEGGLSTRDREKLFAEAGEIARELEEAQMK